jgi:putative ABC transport system permease protein
MYAPFAQTPWPFVTGVVRTTGSPEAAISSMRAAVARVDPMQGIAEVKPLEAYLSRSVATPRFTAVLVGAFAAMALLLAALGLFSVLAYTVTQRRREIGIRIALGARSSDVRALVLRQALQTGLVGLAVGLAGAFAVTRVIGSLLFGVAPHDPATFAGVALLLLAVMLLAAYVPVRRAMSVDPVVALRTE